MRVVQLIAPGPLAGAERVVLEGSDALLSENVELLLVVLDETRKPECATAFCELLKTRGVPVVRISVDTQVDLRALLRLSVVLSRFAPDVVHAHGYKAVAYALAASPGDAKLVATMHGETGHDARARWYEALSLPLLNSVNRVVAVSGATAESLASRGVERSKLRVIENMSGMSLLPPRARAQREPLALLYLGRLAKEKGLDVLLAALTKTREPVTLSIAGQGPERAALQAQASALDLDARVRWLGFATDVRPLLAEADALVLPSMREGLPVCVIEALSTGRPVIASSVGGVPGLVEDGVDGALVPPADVDALASACDLVGRTLPGMTLSVRARAASLRIRYGRERWARETLDVYREVA